MFDPSSSPRVFAEPPGVDFPKSVVDGLRDLMKGHPPEAMARVTLLVNTRRMQRRVLTLFDDGPASLLPRVRLITDLGRDIAMADLPPAVSPLRRRLEMAELVTQLLDHQPDLAPRAAIYDLADSLAGLVDEMQGEGVDPDALRDLDVSHHSAHWARSLAFLDIVDRFFGTDSGEPPDIEARQRMVIERLVARWNTNPPTHPYIIAGSTGSRGATGLLMEAVAKLPQGAVILPGFDFEMTVDHFSALENGLTAEDHPQYRFARLLNRLDISCENVLRWHTATPPAPARNRLVSLALRPAPVTDQWLAEGQDFEGVSEAAARMSLIEAPTPRAEAVAIALVMRDAAETGRQVALITPDRMLTRQVSAALDRWHIEPDDSAGRPLSLTAPGRFLRSVVDLTGTKITGPDLLALLKHPLTHSQSSRGDHLRFSRDLELEALRKNIAIPTGQNILDWAMTRHEGDEVRREWAVWVGAVLEALKPTRTRPLKDHLEQTLRSAQAIAAGPEGEGSGGLWEKAAGVEARKILDELQREAEHGGSFSPPDYRDLFNAILSRGEVRDPIQPHPNIMIWGTLEARVQGVDTIILGGLNDGVWPERPSPDPWMNRDMRHRVNLLLPERRIGLSAHDFQQAIAAPDVILTRAIRDTESETTPSRWLNRMSNLMKGMSQEGADAFEGMRTRGSKWLNLVDTLDDAPSIELAKRPAPMPPVSVRPNRLSVTNVTRLVRDPYAVYARYVLGLSPLDPLHQTPDAPLRGTTHHMIFERFIKETSPNEPRPAAHARLLSTARDVLEAEAPWPAARLLWLAKIERVAGWFLDGEAERSTTSTVVATEIAGKMDLPEIGFTLTGIADRIDRADDGELLIYDYKTGTPPSPKQQMTYDKQLLLEAVMAESGAFEGLAPSPVKAASYIGVGTNPTCQGITVGEEEIALTRESLRELILKYQDKKQGYASRRIVQNEAYPGAYDHLARFGEWTQSDAPTLMEVGE
ncbi:MAG: double-strand break repair protein AddB [Maritimibacter sp.]